MFDDPELNALYATYQALRYLTREEQRRILQWVQARLERDAEMAEREAAKPKLEGRPGD